MSNYSLDFKIKAVLGKYFKSNKSHCSFENFHLEVIPFDVTVLKEVKVFNGKSNKLKTLPPHFKILRNLREIDLSFNDFDHLPNQLFYLTNLRSIQIHHNKICHIDDSIFSSLTKLEILNMNHNTLKDFPESIDRCIQLRKLHLSHNDITKLPESLSKCLQLTELHVGYNKLESIPESVGELIKLKTFIMHKNRLEYLPESLADMVSLKILDVAANNIQVLPSEINELSLNELYYEENPLLQLHPVSSQQIDEIMPLAELCLRAVSKELKNKWSYLHVKLRHFPLVQEILVECGECILCGGAYKEVWIECVHFIKRNPKFQSHHSSSKEIPVRTAICSYSCFNGKEHQFYGIASSD